MLWPQSLCDLIVVETNRYARLRKKGNWVDVNREEMWTCMGINILMGIHKLLIIGAETVCLACLPWKGGSVLADLDQFACCGQQ